MLISSQNKSQFDPIKRAVPKYWIYAKICIYDGLVFENEDGGQWPLSKQTKPTPSLPRFHLPCLTIYIINSKQYAAYYASGGCHSNIRTSAVGVKAIMWWFAPPESVQRENIPLIIFMNVWIWNVITREMCQVACLLHRELLPGIVILLYTAGLLFSLLHNNMITQSGEQFGCRHWVAKPALLRVCMW